MDLSDRQENYNDAEHSSSPDQNNQHTESVASQERKSKAYTDSLPANSSKIPPSIMSQDQNTNKNQENEQKSEVKEEYQSQQNQTKNQQQNEAQQQNYKQNAYDQDSSQKNKLQYVLNQGRVENIVSQSITIEIQPNQLIQPESKQQNHQKQIEDTQENNKVEQNARKIDEQTITAQILVQQSHISDMGVYADNGQQYNQKRQTQINQSRQNFVEQQNDHKRFEQNQLIEENLQALQRPQHQREQQQPRQQIKEEQQNQVYEQSQDRADHQQQRQINRQIQYSQINVQCFQSKIQNNYRNQQSQTKNVPVQMAQQPQQCHVSYLVQPQVSEIQQLRAQQRNRQETYHMEQTNHKQTEVYNNYPEHSQQQQQKRDQYEEAQTNRATDNDLAQQERKQLEDIENDTLRQGAQKQPWERVQSQKQIEQNRNLDQLEVQNHREEIYSQGRQPDMAMKQKKANQENQPSNFDVKGTEGNQQDRQIFEDANAQKKVMKSQPGQDEPRQDQIIKDAKDSHSNQDIVAQAIERQVQINKQVKQKHQQAEGQERNQQLNRQKQKYEQTDGEKQQKVQIVQTKNENIVTKQTPEKVEYNFGSVGDNKDDSQVIPSPVIDKNKHNKLFTEQSSYSQVNVMKVVEIQKHQSKKYQSQYSERMMISSQLKRTPKKLNEQQKFKDIEEQSCKCIIM